MYRDKKLLILKNRKMSEDYSSTDNNTTIISHNNILPRYNDEVISFFVEIEEKLKEKLISRYLNEISNIILTKALKFGYSNIHNSSKHMYIGTHSILDYIIDRLSKLSLKQQRKFIEKNRNFLTHNFIYYANEKYKFLNKESFSIECSRDIIHKYHINDKETLYNNFIDYYKVICNSEINIKYICKSHSIFYDKFNSYKVGKSANIEYSLIQNPIIYYSYCDSTHDIIIYTIALENNCFLLLMRLPNEKNRDKIRKKVQKIMNNIFEFLIYSNVYDIVNNSVNMSDDISALALPYLNNIESTFYDVDKMLEDTYEFKHIFYTVNDENEKCENFQFNCNSKLNIINDIKINKTNKKRNIIKDNILIIDSSFLYGIYNEQYILIGGGDYI